MKNAKWEKRRIKAAFFTLFAVCGAFASNVTAQIASGGQFTLQQTVVANGGIQNASGGIFTLDGTAAQSIAGSSSINSPFMVTGGFWTALSTPTPTPTPTPTMTPTPTPTPTPTLATVDGRVLTSDGRGLRNATMSITDSLGVSRTTTTSSFGFFSFDNVSTGGTYTFRVSSRLFRYMPQTVQVNGNLTLPDFVGLE